MDKSKRMSASEVQRVFDTVNKLAEDDIAHHRRRWPMVRMVVELALGLGWRVSEYAALKVPDLYLDEEYICKTPLKKRKRTGKMIVDTATGQEKPEWVPVRKTVMKPIPSDLCAKLRAYLAWRKQAGIEGEALIVGERGPMTAQGWQKAWNAALIAAGVTKERNGRTVARYSVHCARHTFATDLLRASGNNAAVVKEALNHSSVSTTFNLYISVSDDEQRGAMAGMYEKKP